MAKKEYQVTKAVKIDGEEHGPGDVVALDPSQAEHLLGVFVDEYTPSEKKTPASSAAKSKNDGL